MELSITHADCITFLKGLPSESVDMIFADPPFNKNIRYKGYSDKRLDYKEWCAEWIAEGFRVLKPTGSFYCMTIDQYLEWKLPIMAKYGVWINIIKWKNLATFSNKRSFWYTTQPIMLYGKTPDYKFNPYAQIRSESEVSISWNDKRKESTKYQMLDYWDDIPFVYAGSVIHKEAILEPGTRRKAHSCQMPEMLAARPILFSTYEGDTVVDLFVGSGTTPAACYKLKRNFKGCDSSIHAYNLAVKRIDKLSHNLFAK